MNATGRAGDVNPPVTVRARPARAAAGAHEGRYRPIDIDRTPFSFVAVLESTSTPLGFSRGALCFVLQERASVPCGHFAQKSLRAFREFREQMFPLFRGGKLW